MIPLEVFFLIGEQCDFRTLVQLRLTCRDFSDVLTDLMKSRKRKLFEKFSVIDDETGVTFIPGPAVESLRDNFPLKGIYFVLSYESSRESFNFFLHDFTGWLKGGFLPNGCYVATIDTKMEDVHQEDLGGSARNFVGHWNDLNCEDYRELFARGKAIVQDFWNAIHQPPRKYLQ